MILGEIYQYDGQQQRTDPRTTQVTSPPINMDLDDNDMVQEKENEKQLSNSEGMAVAVAKLETPSVGSDGSVDGDSGAVALSQLPAAKNLEKKKKRKQNSLEKLLADSYWYSTDYDSHSSGHSRDLSFRRIHLKEEEAKLNGSVLCTPPPSSSSSSVEMSLQKFEKSELKTKPKPRSKPVGPSKKEIERQKRIARQKLLEEKRKNGEIAPPKKKAAGSNELSQVMEGALWFNRNSGIDTYTRKVKPVVERFIPEYEQPKRKKIVPLLTSSMTPESVAASPKTPSSKKSRSESPPSDENSRLKSRGKSNKRKRNVKVKTLRRVRVKKEEKRNEEIIIQNNGAEKEEVVVEEEEEEEIEEEIFQWFLNLDCDVEIDINDRQLFIDQVYKLENIENNYSNCPPEENLISASDVVNQFPTHYTVTEKFPEATVFLATPFSNYKEKYLLKIPKDDELNPYEEIGKFMELIAISYLPEVYRLEIRNEKEPEKCIVGKYIKAYEAENSNEMLVQIVKFNELIDKLRDNKTILNYLKDEKRTIKRSIFHELLNQTYSRTISPNVQKLRGYKAFSNFVYGELLPNFLSTVYSRVGLNHKHTFIDLGSGVGNCVIQAALEYGCESYGCEIMEHASQLSKLQTIEFNKRCKVFGLKPGCVDHFLEQSFEDNLAVKKVVDRCDIILVNNYLFDSELNAKVIELLKDIKVGTKLISLKPLVPPGYTFNQLDVECILNRMTSKKYEYGSNSVSWTSNGGIYYISEVQPEIVSAYFMEHAKGRARSRKV